MVEIKQLSKLLAQVRIDRTAVGEQLPLVADAARSAGDPISTGVTLTLTNGGWAAL